MRSLIILLQSHTPVIHLRSKIDHIFDFASSVSRFRGSSRSAKIKEPITRVNRRQNGLLACARLVRLIT